MADHIEISDVEQKGTEKRVIVGFTKGDNSKVGNIFLFSSCVSVKLYWIIQFR